MIVKNVCKYAVGRSTLRPYDLAHHHGGRQIAAPYMTWGFWKTYFPKIAHSTHEKLSDKKLIVIIS